MVKFFVIAIAIAVVVILYYRNTKVKNIMQIEVNIIYDLLQIVTCKLDNNNIEYIMTGGTLLGAIRNKGLIPYDDDGDIVILSDKVRVDDVLTILRELNKDIISYIGIKGNVIIVKLRDFETRIDIFFMNKDENGIYRYRFPFNIQYSNEWYKHDELYPLKEYKFGPLLLKGPNMPSKFLDRTYKNWDKMESKWNHNSILAIENNYTKEFIAKLPDSNFVLKQCRDEKLNL